MISSLFPLLASFAHSPAVSFSISLPLFCHFQFQSPSFFSPHLNPINLSISINIPLLLSLYLSSFSIYPLLFYLLYLSSFILFSLYKFLFIALFPFFLLTLTFLLLFSFIPVLHCLDIIYFAFESDLTKWGEPRASSTLVTRE